MSEVVLATRYSANNYPLALENLAKRYRRSEEPVNYTEVGFGDLSEDQASIALRFFGDIGLLENPKGADYVPPQSVIDWKLKMGDTAEKGRQQVHETLQEYDVYSELTFILEEGEEQLDDLAEQVGGLVGIDEDELGNMKKTIEVFAACEFLEISEDNTVRLATITESDPAEETSEQQPPAEEIAADSNPSDGTEAPTIGEMARSKSGDGGQSPQALRQPSRSAEVEISIDATEMETEDLRAKLEIIEEFTNDGE